MYKIFLLLIFSLMMKAFASEDRQTFFGEFNFNGGHNKTDYKNHDQRKRYGSVDGEFTLKNLTLFGEGEKTKYGLKVSSVLNSEDSSNPFTINEANFIISVKDRGTRMFGFQNSMASKMRIDTTTFNSVSKGVNGAWQNFLYFPTGTFITTQGMALENGFSSSYFLASTEDIIGTNELKQNIQPFSSWGNSNLGLSYVSDRSNGFRFGIFYAPSNQHSLFFRKNNMIDRRDTKDIKYQNDIFLENIFSTALNYYNAFGNLEFAFSVAYEGAKTVSKNYNRRNLNSYSIGTNLSYFGFTIGGSFTNFNQSMQVKDKLIFGNNAYYKDGILTKAKKNYVYDVGLGYAIDKYSLSLSYLKSKHVGNVFWAGLISFETKVSSNLSNYLQIARYQFTEAERNLQKGNKVSGFIFNLGIKYTF